MKSIRQNSILSLVLGLAALALLLAGCKSLLPVRSVPESAQAALYKAPTQQPTAFVSNATPTAQASTQAVECTNLLQFISPDLTFPDGTEVKPGELMDKQWKVRNGGTCNWDSSYTLKLIGGDAMGAEETQALVPARNGTEAVVSIIFTAPTEPGTYRSEWKAYDGNGQAFGDMLYIYISVTGQ